MFGLYSIAESIELSKFIKAGKGEKLVDNSIVGNTLEALIGAYFNSLDFLFKEVDVIFTDVVFKLLKLILFLK